MNTEIGQFMGPQEGYMINFHKKANRRKCIRANKEQQPSAKSKSTIAVGQSQNRDCLMPLQLLYRKFVPFHSLNTTLGLEESPLCFLQWSLCSFLQLYGSLTLTSAYFFPHKSYTIVEFEFNSYSWPTDSTITERKAANTVGGKTARACDGCLRKRARWFCAADDAFLCQACDASIHSANQLASRHERIRLETASCNGGAANSAVNTGGNYSAPAWHQGFTRKARTPRHNNKPILVQQQVKGKEKILNSLPLVPQINGNGSDEEGNMAPDENEDLLLHRVPVFDPFAAELCDILTSEGTQLAMGDEEGTIAADGYEGKLEETCDLDDLPGFLPSDVDLAEFAADVEHLLGQGLDDDDDSPGTYDLALLDCKEEEDGKFFLEEKTMMKVKDEEEVEAVAALNCFDQAFNMPRVSFDWNFDYDSPLTGDDEEEEKVRVPVVQAETIMNSGCKKEMMERNISLRLNYEAVITAWASQGSPWTSGSRPQLNLNDCWPDCKGDNCADDVHQTCGGLKGRAGGGTGEREARVLRYKEKRRKRLFSKKIRYEVRKLNAEKRPRMKGRFVKRTSFSGTAVNNCQPPCLHF